MIEEEKVVVESSFPEARSSVGNKESNSSAYGHLPVPLARQTGAQADRFTFYLSQADVAKKFNTTPRMLLYWESLGLIHPTLAKDPGSKAKRYTFDDLKEIEFVKSLLDEGYSTTALKEKLSKLQSPYRYDGNSLLWDMRDKEWKTREELGAEYLKDNFLKIIGDADAPEKIINFVFDALDKK